MIDPRLPKAKDLENLTVNIQMDIGTIAFFLVAETEFLIYEFYEKHFLTIDKNNEENIVEHDSRDFKQYRKYFWKLYKTVDKYSYARQFVEELTHESF